MTGGQAGNGTVTSPHRHPLEPKPKPDLLSLESLQRLALVLELGPCFGRLGLQRIFGRRQLVALRLELRAPSRSASPGADVGGVSPVPAQMWRSGPQCATTHCSNMPTT
jgi:hypothetical protein